MIESLFCYYVYIMNLCKLFIILCFFRSRLLLFRRVDPCRCSCTKTLWKALKQLLRHCDMEAGRIQKKALRIFDDELGKVRKRYRKRFELILTVELCKLIRIREQRLKYITVLILQNRETVFLLFELFFPKIPDNYNRSCIIYPYQSQRFCLRHCQENICHE